MNAPRPVAFTKPFRGAGGDVGSALCPPGGAFGAAPWRAPRAKEGEPSADCKETRAELPCATCSSSNPGRRGALG
eukprot:4276031-Pyramimonas_sp.AAC.1